MEIFDSGLVQWDSHAQNLFRHGVDPSLGLSAFTFTLLLPKASEVYITKNYFLLLHVLSFNLLIVKFFFIF